VEDFCRSGVISILVPWCKKPGPFFDSKKPRRAKHILTLSYFLNKSFRVAGAVAQNCLSCPVHLFHAMIRLNSLNQAQETGE